MFTFRMMNRWIRMAERPVREEPDDNDGNQTPDRRASAQDTSAPDDRDRSRRWTP